MNTKKIIIIITSIILAIVTCIVSIFLIIFVINQIIAINNANNGGTLTIVTIPWSGWDKTQPAQTTDNYQITATSQKIMLNSDFMPMNTTLTVNKIDTDSIELSTGILGNIGLKQGAGLTTASINLNGCGPKTFTIRREETVELYTCTMDAGIKWELTYQ